MNWKLLLEGSSTTCEGIVSPWERFPWQGWPGKHREEKHNKTQKIEESTRQFSSLHFAENTQYSAEQTINFDFPFLHSFHEDNFRQLGYTLKKCHLHWLLVCFPKMSYFHAHDSEATGRWLVDWRPCFIFPGPRFPRFGTILQCMWIEILLFLLESLMNGQMLFRLLAKLPTPSKLFSKDCLPSQNWIDSILLIIANKAPVVCQFFFQRLLCVSSFHVSSEVISGSE